jgi:hypothetical protein
MYWPVEEDLAGEVGQLGCARQRAIYEEVRNLKEAGAFSELLDWVASVPQYPIVTVNVCYMTLDHGRVEKTSVSDT